MSRILLTAALLLLAACSDKAKEINFPAMPPELKDCRVFHIRNSDGVYLYVVRCPNSTTSTSWRSGKTTSYAAVWEGP